MNDNPRYRLNWQAYKLLYQADTNGVWLFEDVNEVIDQGEPPFWNEEWQCYLLVARSADKPACVGPIPTIFLTPKPEIPTRQEAV